MSRILFFSGVDQTSDGGGVKRSSERLLRGLRSAGHHVDHLSLWKVAEPLAETVRISRASSDAIPGIADWRIGPFHRLGSHSFGPPQTRDLLDCFERWSAARQADVMIGFYLYPAGLACAWAQETLGIPAIVCGRGSDVGKDLLYGNRARSIAWTLERARQPVFVSERLRRIAERYVRMAGPSQVIENSIAVRSVPPAGKRDAATVTYCGVLREKKGIDLLLRAAREGDWGARDVALRLVGDYGSARFRKELEATYPELESGDGVTVTGWQPGEGVRSELSTCSVAVLPSVDEGCPNALLEAFALETPIVASSILAEFFPPFSRHLLFSSRNPRSLEERVRALLDDPDLRRASGERLRRWATERFRPEREIGAYLELIDRLTRRGRTTSPAGSPDPAADEPELPKAARADEPRLRTKAEDEAVGSLRVVAYCGDGVGLGHLTRSTAILRALVREGAAHGVSVEPQLVTATDSVWPATRYGLPVVKLPSKQSLEPRRARPSVRQMARLRRASQAMLHELDPHVLIVDVLGQGTFREFLDGALLSSRHAVLVNRDRRSNQLERPGEVSLLGHFDHVVVPHDDDVDRLLETAPEITDRTGPVLLVETSEMLDRAAARRQVGIDPDALAVLVAPGGITTEDDERLVDAVVAAVRRLRSDAEIVVLARNGGGAGDVRRLDYFPVAELLPAFDVAVGAAGYNTVHELLHAGLPSALYAKPRTVDDQEARIGHFAELGACVELDGADPRIALEPLLTDATARDRLAAAARSAVPGGGARRAARCILRRYLESHAEPTGDSRES